MNEQMQQALIKIIEKANSGVDASINFLGDQLPDVVHQLLTWGLLSSIVSCFKNSNRYKLNIDLNHAFVNS